MNTTEYNYEIARLVTVCVECIRSGKSEIHLDPTCYEELYLLDVVTCCGISILWDDGICEAGDL